LRADDAPAAPEHPVSQTGDLWTLGKQSAGDYRFRVGPGAAAVQPGVAPVDPAKSEDTPKNGGDGGGGGRTPEIDPIIRGLLARLPKSGDVWSEADRKLWLNLLEGSFKLIYKDKDAPPSDGQHEAER